MKWPKEFPKIGPLSPAQNLNMLVTELPDFAIRQLSTIRANRRSIRVFTIRKSARPCIAFDLWRVAAGVRGAHPPNTIFHRRQLDAAGAMTCRDPESHTLPIVTMTIPVGSERKILKAEP